MSDNAENLMNISTDGWTYGVELEYGNCSRKVSLPDGAQWNFLDNTCVSSTGIANDPKGELYEFGGEINTRPTDSIDEQIEHIRKINASINPIINYRSNLHIHIRVPELNTDLNKLKQLLTYTFKNCKQAFDLIEPIPVPERFGKSNEEYTWEMKRYKRRQRSHQHQLSMKQYTRMMNADNIRDFFENEVHRDKYDNPAWYQAPRAGINIRQIYETNTLEFRHFPGTLYLDELKDAIDWCRCFLWVALNEPNITPKTIFDSREWKIPKFADYEYHTEQGYQYTNFDKNSRKVVEHRLKRLRDIVDIDDLNTSSKSTFDAIQKIEQTDKQHLAKLPI